MINERPEKTKTQNDYYMVSDSGADDSKTQEKKTSKRTNQQ